MLLPKIEPLLESVALIEVQSLVLEEKPVTLTPVPPHAALPNRIAVVGNYLPRHCGIATFTTDLCDALHAEYAATELLALPVNDTEEGYDYPIRVRFELSENNLASYRQAADFLNFSNVDLVCLQHEYGIRLLLDLIDDLIDELSTSTQVVAVPADFLEELDGRRAENQSGLTSRIR